jgi:apolipoprotein N-acyltransferase
MIPLYWALFPAETIRIAAPPKSRLFRTQFLRGYFFGALFYALHLHWLLQLSKEEITIPWIMIPALAVLGGYLGVFPGLAAAGAGWLQRRFRIHPWWGFPAAWTLFDWFRTIGETGFAWGSLGYALAPVPAALQLTAWTGFWLLPFWIALVSGMLWRAFTRREMRHRVRWSACAAAVFVLPTLFGAWLLHEAPSGVRIISPERFATQSGTSAAVPPKQADALRFTLLQANTPREIKWDPNYRELVVSDLLARTEIAVGRYHPDLVVWPETAAPLRILWEDHLALLTSATVDSLDTWTLVGTLDARVFDDRPAEHYNAAVLYAPNGEPVWRYAKRRMVPFGELTPYKRYLPFLAEIDFGQSDFTMGREPGNFEVLGSQNLSCLICFESTFPELARGDVARGAKYLVNITNDFWYGRSAGPYQHQDFAIHRAVENRTPLVRCANSGISCIIDAHGRVYAETELFEDEYVTADVVPGTGGTFYTRMGDWVLFVMAASLVAGILASRRRAA